MASAKEIAQEFVNELLSELKQGFLILPTLPDVVVKIRAAIDDSEADVKSVIRVLSTDPSISARLILIANSPLMRGSKKVESIDRAVNRLGLVTVRDVVTAIVIEQLFEPTSRFVEQRLRDAWEHSTTVAAISYTLAKNYCSHINPEQALLAGLLHDIGALPIITKAESKTEVLADPRILDSVVRKYHTHIGKVLLTAWDFPDDIITAVAEHENLARNSNSDKADLADLILVANLLSYVGESHKLLREDWSKVSAFAKVGISHDVDIMANEADEQVVKETKAMLQQ